MNILSSWYSVKNNCIEIASLVKNKNAFVFGMPFHSNAGDQAQTYCIELWININYPNHRIRWFDSQSMYYSKYQELEIIKRTIKKKDLVFLHSGYHTTDLYMWEENLQREVIKAFPKHRIIVLPQTVNYTTEKEKNKSIQIYNQHKDLLFFCRDSVSLEKAKQLFPKCKLYLYPDIVTSMIGQRKYDHERKGILLCLRNDKEALITEDKKELLIRKLSSIDTVDVTDTTLKINSNEFIQNRKAILENEWDNYAKYRVVITDRYHGTIFSLIASTPVLVIPSTDHKLESGVEWFPDSYKEYVRFVTSISEIAHYVEEVYSKKYDYMLPSYFKEKYYDKLKEIIEGE